MKKIKCLLSLNMFCLNLLAQDQSQVDSQQLEQVQPQENQQEQPQQEQEQPKPEENPNPSKRKVYIRNGLIIGLSALVLGTVGYKVVDTIYFPSTIRDLSKSMDTKTLLPLDQTSKQTLIDGINHKDADGVKKILIPLINQYLGGKYPLNETYMDLKFGVCPLVGVREIAPGCMFYNHTSMKFDVYLNEQTFDQSLKEGVYSVEEVVYAKMIVLIHEFTHVWQSYNYLGLSSQQKEGHAVFMQSIFAIDNQIHHINIKGIDAINRSKDVKWYMLKGLHKIYYRGYELCLQIYEGLTQFKGVERVQEATRMFLQ